MTINDKRGGACCNFALVIERRDNRVQIIEYRVQITEYNYLAGCAHRMGKRPDGESCRMALSPCL